MMSTRRTPRLPPEMVVGAVVEDIHALPAVIVHPSVSVVAAHACGIPADASRRFQPAKFASSLSKATSSRQNPHLSAKAEEKLCTRSAGDQRVVSTGAAGAQRTSDARSGERTVR